MAKVSVFLKGAAHTELKRLALDRRLSLTKLIARICDEYRARLHADGRRKKAA